MIALLLASFVASPPEAKIEPKPEKKGKTSAVASVRFRDADTLLVVKGDYTARWVAWKSGEEKAHIAPSAVAGKPIVFAEFGPKERFAAWYGTPNRFHSHKLDGTLLGVSRFPVETWDEFTVLEYSPKADTAAVGCGKKLVVVDGSSFKTVWEVPVVGPAKYSPDGKHLAAGPGPDVSVFDLGTRATIGKLKLPEIDKDVPEAKRFRFADENRLLAVFGVRTVVVGTPADGKVVFTTRRVAFRCQEVGDVSPDGRWLAHGSTSEQEFAIRDLKDPKSGPTRVTLPSGDLTDIAFSPDGRHCATATSLGTVFVWDLDRISAPPRGK